MKKPFKFLLAAVLLALLFFFFSSTEKDIREESKELVSEVKKEVSSEYDESNIEYREKLVQTEEKLKARHNEAIERQHERGIKSNVLITFYAQILDQYKNPIPDVEINLEILKYNKSFLMDVLAINGKPSRNLRESLSLKTDNNGYFQVVGEKGKKLHLVSLIKNGYLDKYENRHFQAWEGNQEFGSQENPIVYTLWKQGETEELIKTSMRYGTSSDGSFSMVDLLKKKSKGNTNIGGDLFIAVNRPEGIKHGDKFFTWSYTLKASNGGLIVTEDTFLYEAPEDGYTDVITGEFTDESENWSDRVKKKVYIKSRGGEVYSSGTIEILGNYNGKTGFEIEYITNPKGSRNLEYDPAKDVTKQYVSR